MRSWGRSRAGARDLPFRAGSWRVRTIRLTLSGRPAWVGQSRIGSSITNLVSPGWLVTLAVPPCAAVTA